MVDGTTSNMTQSVVKLTAIEMSSVLRLGVDENAESNNLKSGGKASGDTFILKGFNDSQEIHSSRNLGVSRGGALSSVNNKSAK